MDFVLILHTLTLNVAYFRFGNSSLNTWLVSTTLNKSNNQTSNSSTGHFFFCFFVGLISSSHQSENTRAFLINFSLTNYSLDMFSWHSYLWFEFFFPHHLQLTIILTRWSAPIQLPDGHINTLYSGAVTHHVAWLCAFGEGSLRREIYSYPIPLLLGSPVRLFLSLLLSFKSATIQCGRLLPDSGSSLTREHWAAGAAVNDCSGASDDYGSLRDVVHCGSAWSGTGVTPDH